MNWGKIQLTMVQPVAYRWNFMFVFQEATLVKKEKNCGLLIKRTNGTTGMKGRFDKDKNFKLFTICSKMVTGLCQNIFMSFTSDCTYQIRFVNYLHRLKIPERSKWYRRHSSVRYVLFCRSTCNFWGESIKQTNFFVT